MILDFPPDFDKKIRLKVKNETGLTQETYQFKGYSWLTWEFTLKLEKEKDLIIDESQFQLGVYCLPIRLKTEQTLLESVHHLIEEDKAWKIFKQYFKTNMGQNDCLIDLNSEKKAFVKMGTSRCWSCESARKHPFNSKESLPLYILFLLVRGEWIIYARCVAIEPMLKRIKSVEGAKKHISEDSEGFQVSFNTSFFNPNNFGLNQCYLTTEEIQIKTVSGFTYLPSFCYVFEENREFILVSDYLANLKKPYVLFGKDNPLIKPVMSKDFKYLRGIIPKREEACSVLLYVILDNVYTVGEFQYVWCNLPTQMIYSMNQSEKDTMYYTTYPGIYTDTDTSSYEYVVEGNYFQGSLSLVKDEKLKICKSDKLNITDVDNQMLLKIGA